MPRRVRMEKRVNQSREADNNFKRWKRGGLKGGGPGGLAS